MNLNDTDFELFAVPPTPPGAEAPGTLFDFLTGYIGTVAGAAEPYSQDCGRRFAEGLAERQQRGQP